MSCWCSLTFAAADGVSSAGENPFCITLQGTVDNEIQPRWDALAAAAKTRLIPLAPAPFAPLHGLLTDRDNVPWMVDAGSTPTTD